MHDVDHGPERGHEQRAVDLGTAVEPDGVLPQNRSAPPGEDPAAVGDVDIEDGEPGHEDRHREHHDDAAHDRRPGERRDAQQVGTGRAQLDHRRHEVDRRQHRRDGDGAHAQDPQPARVPGGRASKLLEPQERAGRERPAANQVADGHEDATGEVEPEGERLQPRERQPVGTDHAGDEAAGDTDPRRRKEEEDHDRGVEREQLVAVATVEDLEAGAPQLDPQHQRDHAPEHEERKGGDEVGETEASVIEARDPRRGCRSGRHRRRFRHLGRGRDVNHARSVGRRPLPRTAALGRRSNTRTSAWPRPTRRACRRAARRPPAATGRRPGR